MQKNKNKAFSVFYSFAGLIQTACRHAIIRTVIIFGLIVFLPSTSYAQCTNPASPVGGISYDSAGDYLAVMACDGTDWVPWAGWTVSGYPAPQFSSGGGALALDDLSDAITSYTSGNLYVGDQTGTSSTTGTGNTFVGTQSGVSTNTGALNTALGLWSGFSNTSGNTNVFLGYSAGYSNTIGTTNTAIGGQAFFFNSSGTQNTAIGDLALQNSTSSNNTAVGSASLLSNTTGTRNNAMGRIALGYNETGSGNIAIGVQSGQGVAAGSSNVSDNVFIGDAAASNILTGANRNTVVGGGNAAATLTTGSDNIIIGYAADVSAAGDSNKLNIGDVIYGSGMYNTGHIGINDTTPDVALDVVGDINYTGQIVDVSDIRLKENVRPLQSPLKKLISLNGIAFEMKGDPKRATEYGVSAQDVEKVFPELVHQVDSDGTLGVNYNGLIAPLIEAMKEQQAQIEALQAEIEALKAEQNNKPGEL